MCTVVDIVDQKRVVVDGPASVTGVARHMMPVKRLSLTDLRAAVPRGAREKTLRLALEKDSIMSKWAETSWAKKLKAKEAPARRRCGWPWRRTALCPSGRRRRGP